MLISSIYGMNRAIFKVGERKGKSVAEINKMNKARLKKSKKGKNKRK